jgi:short-subunit dehydrogenase
MIMPETNASRSFSLVTGPTAGIGEVFARRLAAAGRNLVLVARNRDRLQALGDELKTKHGIDVEVLAADLAVHEDLVRVEKRIGEIELDMLVNNAGFGLHGQFEVLPVEGHQRMLDVHVVAPVRLMRAALPGMIARGRGDIVNVSSLAGFSASLGSPVYGATKACLTFFSEALSVELARTGVRVQALCPGFTHTEFHERAGVDKKTIPSWAWGSAEKVVDASLRALASDRVICIPGLKNKAIAALLRSLPRSLLRAIAKLIGRASDRPPQRG